MNPILQMGKNYAEFLFLPRQLSLTGTRQKTRGGSSKRHLLHHVLWDRTKQWSGPGCGTNQSPHVSQDTWSKLELLILVLLLLYWCHMPGLTQEEKS